MDVYTQWVKQYAVDNNLSLREGWFAGDRTLSLREQPTEMHPEGRLVAIALATYDINHAYMRMRELLQRNA